jgi:hypothetical protein
MQRQIAAAKSVQASERTRLGLAFTDADAEMHWIATGYEPRITPEQLCSVKAWFLDILNANKTAGVYDQNALLAEVLYRHALLSEYARDYARNPDSLRTRIKRRIKDCVKALIHG